MTIFVNYKVYDYNNNFIGATGVGLSLPMVTKLINDYEQRYQRTVYFTGINDNIDVYGNHFGNQRTLQ